MFCENCGKEIENDSLFCGYCGEKVNSSYEINSLGENVEGFQPEYNPQNAAQTDIISDSGYYTQYQQPAEQDYAKYYKDFAAPQKPAPKKKNGIVIGLVIAAVAVVIALGVALFFFMGDNNPVSVNPDDSGSSQADTVVSEDSTDENMQIEITGNTRILPAYEEGGIFAPEKLYNDIDYYVSCSVAALYKESGAYGRGQIAQLDANDVVTVKGAMEGSNWVYVYCKELDIYGWIEPASISSTPVETYAAKADKREVIYYSENNCHDAYISVGKGHNLNLRNIPSSLDDSTVVRLIADGEKVQVIGVSATDGDWYYVCYDSFDYGKLYGFMSGEYLDMD